MYDVFISYSTADKSFAKALARKLEKKGFSVYFDEGLLTGSEFLESSFSAIREAKLVVVLLSKHSKRSKFVEAELQSALDSSKNIIPILLDSSATENWVWPLLADRQAIVLEPKTNIKKVLSQIADAVSPHSPAKATRLDVPADLPISKRLSWPVWVISLLTGILGAIISWFFFT